MPTPAGITTNFGKMLAVGALVGGVTTGSLHLLDGQFGHWGSLPDEPQEKRTEYGQIEYTQPGPAQDGWRKATHIVDTALVLTGGAAALGGGMMAASDLSRAARALGETAASPAMRGGRLLAETEALLGVGIGIVAATIGVAALTGLLEPGR